MQERLLLTQFQDADVFSQCFLFFYQLQVRRCLEKERSPMNIYHVLCLHERKRVPYSETIDDYHPLSRKRLKWLLRVAQRDEMARGEVCIRLHQAVKGYTCPRPLEGDIATKLSQISKSLDELCSYATDPPKITDAHVAHLWEIINSNEKE
jgi:hypothetical protein